MKKELIIILFKINISNFTQQQHDKYIEQLMSNCKFDDVELKENYIIKQIYLPVTNQPYDVKVIYSSNSNLSEIVNSNLSEIVKEIESNIKKYPSDNKLRKSWNNLLRELKLQKLNNTN